jgi:hypothetical protein
MYVCMCVCIERCLCWEQASLSFGMSPSFKASLRLWARTYVRPDTKTSVFIVGRIKWASRTYTETVPPTWCAYGTAVCRRHEVCSKQLHTAVAYGWSIIYEHHCFNTEVHWRLQLTTRRGVKELTYLFPCKSNLSLRKAHFRLCLKFYLKFPLNSRYLTPASSPSKNPFTIYFSLFV